MKLYKERKVDSEVMFGKHIVIPMVIKAGKIC